MEGETDKRDKIKESSRYKNSEGLDNNNHIENQDRDNQNKDDKIEEKSKREEQKEIQTTQNKLDELNGKDDKDNEKTQRDDKEVGEDKQNIEEVKERKIIESKEEETKEKSKEKKQKKKHKEKETKETETEEEVVEIDLKDNFNKIKGIFKKRAFLIPTLLIIIAMIFSIHFRLQPLYLPFADEQAEKSVEIYYKNIIMQEINKRFPNAPIEQKRAILNKQWQEFMKENKEQIEAYKKGTAEQIRSYLRDEHGMTYLLAIDPYIYLRQAKHYLDHGYAGTELLGGGKDWKQKYYDQLLMYPDLDLSKPIDWDGQRMAPIGSPSSMSLHVYFTVFIYKIFSIFKPGILVRHAMFFVPVIVATLAVIPAFFIGKKISGSYLGGFVAALIVATHPAFLDRTCAGFADTDPYNITLPLFVIWFFIEACERKTIKGKIVFGVLSGLSLAIFSFAWGGWWYIFDILLVSLVLYIIYLVILANTSEEIKRANPILNTFIIFLVSFLVFNTIKDLLFNETSVIKSLYGTINSIFLGPIGIAKLKQVAVTTLWPNIQTTVAELNPASTSSVINNMGSSFLVTCAFLGIVFALSRGLKKKAVLNSAIAITILFLLLNLATKDAKFLLVGYIITIVFILVATLITREYKKGFLVSLKYAFILLFWSIAIWYATTKGVRFIMMLVPPFAISLGAFVGILYDIIAKLVNKEIDKAAITKSRTKRLSKSSGPSSLWKTVVNLVLIFLLLWVFTTPILKAGWGTAKHEIPSFDDGWYTILNNIKVKTKNDSIVNSWWDFGHWFITMADRRVTFDGAGQDRHMAYWIGRSLYSNDERLSLGILRMVDCGNNNAFWQLNAYINDTVKSIDILNKIVVMSKKQAHDYLYQILNDENKVNKVLKYTHCNAPDNYYITSQDMVGKAGVWGHFGTWDFKRAKIWQHIKTKKLSRFEAVEWLKKEFNMSEDKANKIYDSLIRATEANYWISPWPQYLSNPTQCKVMVLNVTNKTINKSWLERHIKCALSSRIGTFNIDINYETKEPYIEINGEKKLPKVFMYYDYNIGDYVVKNYSQNTLDMIGIDLIEERIVGANSTESKFYILLTTPELTASTFTKLFFYEKSNYFEMFDKQQSFTTGKIITWKAKWDMLEETAADREVDKVINITTNTSYTKQKLERYNKTDKQNTSHNNNNNINNNKTNKTNITITEGSENQSSDNDNITNDSRPRIVFV